MSNTKQADEILTICRSVDEYGQLCYCHWIKAYNYMELNSRCAFRFLDIYSYSQ